MISSRDSSYFIDDMVIPLPNTDNISLNNSIVHLSMHPKHQCLVLMDLNPLFEDHLEYLRSPLICLTMCGLTPRILISFRFFLFSEQT